MALRRFLERKPESEKRIKIQTCSLKPINSSLPDIIISDKPIKIGRSPVTCIKDLLCSKNQILVKADFLNSTLMIKACGTNPSGLNGFLLHSGKVYEAYHDDIIELLYGRYKYKIDFSSYASVKVEKEEIELKKEKIEIKKEKIEIKKEKTEMKKEIVSKAFEDDSGNWDVVDNGKLYVYTPKDNKCSEKVAAYDLDGTLICTMSGNVFPKHIDDWKILYSEIPNKLKSLHNMNFKIVIFTNQAGIGKGNLNIADFKHKVFSILKRIGVPIQVFISTQDGMYRKPLPGMWTCLEEKYNGNIPINTSKSFYIGDAAGRIAIPPKIKKDFSCADRLFALNIGIPFMTPEEHFLNEKPRQHNITVFNPKEIKNTSWLSPKVVVPSKEPEIILLVGLQGSGKSYFARQVLEPIGYGIVNRDTLKTMDACLEMCRRKLKEGKRCVVDNTNVDVESRKRFLELAKTCKVKCRCFIMNVTVEQISHNIKFRRLTDSKAPKINEMVLNSFKKKFVNPSEAEGFSEIVKVNPVLSFKNSEEEKLYKMYLNEK